MVRIILILITTVLISCKSSEQNSSAMESNAPIIFTELNAGNNGGFPEKTQKVITTQNEFNSVWDAAFINYSLKDDAPIIDFKTKTIILVTFGENNNGGAEIKVEKIIETNENVVVSILETKAGEGCVTNDMMVYPYQIVELEKPTKKITFKSTLKVIDCD